MNRGNIGAKEVGVIIVIYLDAIIHPEWPEEAYPLCDATRPVNIQYAHEAKFTKR